MDFTDFKGKTIRLTDERWSHINQFHPETIGQIQFIGETIHDPDLVQSGMKDELLAIKKYAKTPISEHKYCIVVYKYDDVDGFIITAYFSRRPSFRRNLVWKK